MNDDLRISIETRPLLLCETLQGQLRFTENEQSRWLLKETARQDADENNRKKIRKGSVQSDDYILLPDIPKYDNTPSQKLQGRAQEQKLEAQTGKLETGAKVEDPDAGDMLIQLDWQKFHQRFYDTIRSNMSAKLRNPDLGKNYFDYKYGEMMTFPLGTVAYYKCVIDRNLHIQSLEITKSSGIELYDQLLLESIKDLEKQQVGGEPVLQFPEKSRRVEVVEANNLQYVRQLDTYSAPHDIESYRVPK